MTIATKPQVERFPADTAPSTFWESVERDGAAIITGAVPVEVLQRFQREVEGSDETSWLEDSPTLKGKEFPCQARHANNLVPTSETYRQDILNSPVIHGICRVAFKETGDYWLTTSIFRATQPGNTAQAFHRDNLLHPLMQYQPTSSPALAMGLLISMTDSTEANGGTRVILGSHRWDTVGTPSEDQSVRVKLDAGDLMILRQGLVHAGGEHSHKAPDTRRMLIMFFSSCQITQLESPLALPRSLVESMTPLAQKMVGWRTVKPVEPNVVGLNTYRSRPLEEGLALKANVKLNE